MRLPTILVVAAALLSAFSVTAQEDAKERVRREVDQKQKLMREGKVLRINVRVTVRLNNGSRLRGVVKQGRMVERHDGLEFIPSDLKSKGAGIRLWYYDQTDSYIFLPFEQIKEHQIGERLTDDEVKALGLELEQQAREAQERARSEHPRPTPEQLEAEQRPTPGGGGATTEQGDGLSAEQTALLAEYPPEGGWGPLRRREIELRKFQVNVWPNKQEQKFLDNFDAWTDAKNLRDQLAAEKAEADAKVETVRPQVLRPQPEAPSVELSVSQRELLQAFPSEDGWGPERQAELHHKVQLGQIVNPEEREFLQNYQAWQEAFQIRQAIENEESAENDSGEIEPGEGAGPVDSDPDFD